MDLLRRRRALSTALALLLAVESVVAVSAAAGTALAARATTHPLPAASPAGRVLAETGKADAAWAPERAATTIAGATVAGPDHDYQHPRTASAAAPAPKAAAKPALSRPTAKPVAKASAKPAVKTVKKSTTSSPKAVAYRGRNHVWIPSLGVNRSVSFFSCTRSAPPDNYVYRWGCAGTNNVYLLGHAYGVFKPLHDSYLNGRLRVGMRVYYADGSGKTHVYAVKWWKLTRPTTDASWAWAAQAVPSMTLQTCIGANSEYRLIVRLVQVG